MSGRLTRCPSRLFLPFFPVFFSLILAACSRPDGLEREASLLAQVDTGQLRQGDLVFRMGYGLESRAVVAADRDAMYSHVGLLVRDEGGWRVLHAVPGESEDTGGEEVLKKDSLPLYLRYDRACAVCVLRYDTSEDALAEVCRQGLRLYAERVPFDHSYDMADSSRLYCTEFVTNVFHTIGVDLPEGRSHHFPLLDHPLVYPIDISSNSRLEEVFTLSKKK